MNNITYIIYIRRVFIAILISFGFFSCVKQIEPEIETLDVDKYVVYGMLTDIDGFQSVYVSKTSTLNNPAQIPISNCTVKLIREDGDERLLYEYADGEYRLYIGTAFFDKSKMYKIQVQTPNNTFIESTFESFSSCPDIDKVYYEYVEKPVAGRGKPYLGYQFYIDLNASEEDSKYYIYNLTETFEHHSPYPLEYWWDGVLHREVPPDYSKMYCWVTAGIRDIFPLSTESFTENKYLRYKLNYTTNRTQRLEHTYSLLIEQLAVSKGAYEYWEQMRKNMKQSGGMYNGQPIAVRGNLSSTNISDKSVLGYFGLASQKEKRIFIPPSPIYIIDNSCTMRILRFGFREISWRDYPAYLYSEGGVVQAKLMDNTCVDCTKMGGYTTKPSFWP